MALVCTQLSTCLGISLATRDITMWLGQMQLSLAPPWPHGRAITMRMNHCDALSLQCVWHRRPTLTSWAAVGLSEAAVSAYPAYDGVHSGGSERPFQYPRRSIHLHCCLRLVRM